MVRVSPFFLNHGVYTLFRSKVQQSKKNAQKAKQHSAHTHDADNNYVIIVISSEPVTA